MDIKSQQFAEDAVLGCILAENYLINDLPLSPELFSGKNKMLYMAMKKLNEQRLPIDLVTLVTKGGPQDWDGASRIQQLQRLSDVKKVDSYFKVINDAYKERKKDEVLTLALNEKWTVGAVQEALNGIDTNNSSDRKNSNEIAVKMFNLPWEKNNKAKGMPTGIKKLDIMTNGLQDSTLTIIGARPSMGKSDMMMHMALNAAEGGYKVIVFSLEMASEKLFERMVGMVGGINRNKLKDPEQYFSDKDKKNWSFIMDKLSKTGIEFFDAAGQTDVEIRSKIRKVQSENPDKKLAIFMDYLTLARTEKNFYNDTTRVTYLTEEFKAIAKEFKCPFITLAQLSREVEKRPDKRPMMSDLRDSGGIEQGADLIAFLYRDSYYSGDKNDRSLEFIVSKNREGETGTIMCEYSTFTGVIKDANM